MICLNNTANSIEFSKTLNFGSKSANLMMSSMILSSYCRDNNITSQDGIDGVSSSQLTTYWFNANKSITQDVRDAFLAHMKRNYYVTKIISGGQTGVDTIGLEVGSRLGIETGGTAAPGFYTENGKDSSLSRYGLEEITPELQKGFSGGKFYLPRTEQNVLNSDGTVYFSTSGDSSGQIATSRYAKQHNKHFIENPTPQQLAGWIRQYGIKTLNVAGNRGSKLDKNNNVAQVLEEALNILAGENESGTDKKVSVARVSYRKGDPWVNTDTDYVFTENAEAAEEIWGIVNGSMSGYADEFPFKGTPKINVSDMNGSNQAGIRTNSKGEITPNAYGIVVKKYQHDEKGGFVAREGQFQDTDSDFEMFKQLNERVFDELNHSSNSKIVFPDQLALGKAALPLRFATWLQARLKEEFGVKSLVMKNKRSDYDGYGLHVTSIMNNSSNSTQTESTAQQAESKTETPVQSEKPSEAEAVKEETTKEETPKEEPVDERENLPSPHELVSSEAANEELRKDSTLMKQCNIDIPASIRADRVRLVADLFSTGLDIRIEGAINNLNKQIDEEKDDIIKAALVRVRDKAMEDRLSLIKKGSGDTHGYITIQECFEEGRKILRNYMNASQEDRIKYEMDNLGLTREKAEVIVGRKLEAYPKIDRYYKILAREAAGIITYSEGIRIDINLGGKELSTGNEENNSVSPDSTNNDVEDESDAKDEQTKEGWSIEWNEVDPYLTLSAKVRQLLTTLPVLDAEGYAETDDLGNQRTVDPGAAHTLLMSRLRYINDVDDMMNELRSLAKSKPWVTEIIDRIEGSEEYGYEKDPQLLNIFYHDFSKEYTEAYILKVTEDANGVVSHTLMPVNSDVTSTMTLDEAKDNINGGIILSKNSIYDKGRKINRKNLENLNNLVKSIDKMDGISEESVEALTDVLHAIGFNVSKEDLMGLFREKPAFFENILTDISSISNKADEYFTALEKNPDTPIYSTFGSYYKSIAKSLADTLHKEVPASYRENDKMRYSYTPKSFLGKTVNHLANRAGYSEEKFMQWINDHYLKYKWFRNNGVILSPWLDNLINGTRSEISKKSSHKGFSAKEMRDNLTFCTLHNKNKLNYENWDSLDAILSLYNMYKSGDNELKEKRTMNHFAWYALPPLSDSFIAQFIRFKKYDMNTKYSLGDYKDMIINDLSKVVAQEVNRITLVKKRNEEGMTPLMNFDMSFSKDGKGGSKFFFIKELNDIKVGDRSFYDKYMELASQGDDKAMLELNELVKNTLENIMKDKFEKFYHKAESVGMLDKTGSGDNSRYKYFPGINLSETKGSDDAVKARLEEFFYNHSLAQTQIIELLTGDLAYYKNTNDFIKRWKEVYSSMLRLNTKAEYKKLDGTIEKVGRQYETALYIDDLISVSKLKKDVEQVLSEKVKKHQITEEEKIGILNHFDEINVTDGQAFRTLDSYRAMRIMSGEHWTPDMEKAFESMKKGDWTMKEFNQALQIVKPFTYSMADTKADNEGNRMAVPVQHKDSEALLLYQMIAHLPGQNILMNPILEGLAEFMNIGYGDGMNHGVDVAIFSSGVKVGLQGAVDIYHRQLTEEEKNRYNVNSTKALIKKLTDAYLKNQTDKDSKEMVGGKVVTEELYNSILDSLTYKNKEDVVNYLKSVTGVDGDFKSYKESKNTEDYIHKVDYDDYGVQVETPEHMYDTEQMIGSQIAKLGFSDIPDGFKFSLGGMMLDKKAFLSLYNSMCVAGRLDGLYRLLEDAYPEGNLSDKTGISRLILQSMSGDNKYSYDMLRAAMVDSNGQFILPPYEGLHTGQIQNICFALLRSRVVKQKTPGGSAIQATCFGNNNLHIKFSNDPVTGKKRVEYIPCFLPFYLKERMEDYTDSNGNIDMKRIDPELLKVVGYRIPTEDKYSMMPLKIVGFLPQAAGTMIIMPEDITLLTGSDFDVDKVFLIFPEIDRKGTGTSYRDYVNNVIDNASDEIYERVSSQLKSSQRFSYEDSLYQQAYENAVRNLRENHVSDELLQKEIDNEYKRLVYSQEGNDAEEYIERKAEYVRELRKRIRILKNQIRESLLDTTSEAYENSMKTYNSEIESGNISRKELHKLSYELPLDESGNIDAEKVLSLEKEQRNNIILDQLWASLTSSQAAEKMVYPQNFDNVKRAGKIMRILGSSENRNTLEQLDRLSDKEIDALADKYSEKQDILSPEAYLYYHQQNTVGKQMIAIYASHNVAHALCQNTQLEISDEYSFVFGDHQKPLLSLHEMYDDKGRLISKNMASFLGAAADTAKDPILADLSQNSTTADISCLLIRLGYSPLELGLLLNQPVVREILEKKASSPYSRLSEVIGEVMDDLISKSKIDRDTLKQLEKRRFDNNALVEMIDNGDMDTEEQIAIGLMFNRIAKIADSLRTVTSAMRFDTTKGSIGATEGDVVGAEQKVENQKSVFTGDHPVFKGDYMVNGYGTDGIPDDRTEAFLKLMGTPLPLIEASYYGTVGSVSTVFKDMFMSSIPLFKRITQIMASYTRNNALKADTINSVSKAFQYYMLTDTDTFGAEEGLTSEDKRWWYINKFPQEFSDFKNNRKYSGEFFDALSIGSDTRTGATVIQLKSGRLSYERRDNMMRDWMMMLESEDKEVSDMAKKLFVYGLFKYGLRYYPTGFMHLASIDILSSIPGYTSSIEKLKDMTNTSDDIMRNLMSGFIVQYVRNNPLSEMTVKVDTDSLETKGFLKEGKLQDEVDDSTATAGMTSSPAYLSFIYNGEPVLYGLASVSGESVYQRLGILHNEYDADLESNINSVYMDKSYYASPKTFTDGVQQSLGDDYLDSFDIRTDDTIGTPDDFSNISLEDFEENIAPFDNGRQQFTEFSNEDVIAELSIGDNEKTEYNEELNTHLRELMGSYGISAGSLTTLEEELGMNGVAEFDKARKSAEGIIEVIRLAKGIKGEKALPEEFAHWAYRVLLDKGDVFAKRMLDYVINNNLAEVILGDNYSRYSELYHGNKRMLAEEAAGHLIADKMCERYNKKGIINKIAALFSRVYNAIINFFSKKDEDPLVRAMDYANKGYGKIALGILDNTYKSKLKGGADVSETKLFNVAKEVSRLKDIAQNMLDRELKFIHIQRSRKARTREEDAERTELLNNEEGVIKNLSENITNGVIKEGILETLEESVNTLSDIKNTLSQLEGSSSGLISRGIRLRNIKNRLYQYSGTILELRDFINTDHSDDGFNGKVKMVLDRLASLYADADSMWNNQALNVFAEYLKPYLGKKVQITIGKNKGKVYDDVRQLLKEVDSDISQADLWLESMSNSGDYILRAVDQAVKESKGKKKLRVIEYSKRIKALGMELREKGVTSFDFMYQRDDKGNLTGDYITEEQSRRLGYVQKNFYDSYIKIYDELKELIPQKYSDSNRGRMAVQIRKDLMERMLSSGSLSAGAEQLFANAAGKIARREDDDSFGIKYGIQDFAGKEYNMVPVYYMNRIENPSRDMSTDAISTLIAFADTAVNYDEMSKISDMMEVGKTILGEDYRKVMSKEGGRQKMGVFTEMGNKVTSKMLSQSNNILAKFQSFMESQIYGKYIKDEGGIDIPLVDKTVDKAKLMDTINRMNSTFVLAGNMLSGLSSMLSDITMINSEALAGQFFNLRELNKADRIYGKELMTSIADTGSRVKTGKLNLFIELFDLMREDKERDEQFDKGRIRRFISMDTLYFFQHAGDHWGNCRTALAMALHMKLKDRNGREINLWDALDIEYLDNNNHSKGARLKIKEGVRKEDGTLFEEKDIIRFSNKCRGLSNYLFGVYNKYDSAVAQRYILGRIGLTFRKYLIPAYERRFMKANYNLDLDAEMEGYYVTAGRMIMALGRDLRKGKLTIAATWHKMTPLEQQNIKRAVTEEATCLLLSVACFVLNKNDNLKKRPWLLRSLVYYTNRLRYEVSVLTPSVGMISDNIQLTKNAFPIMNAMDGMLNLLNIFYPTSWVGEDSEVKQGFMKGYKVGLKDIVDSPFTPRIQTIWKGLHPENYMNTYKR